MRAIVMLLVLVTVLQSVIIIGIMHRAPASLPEPDAHTSSAVKVAEPCPPSEARPNTHSGDDEGMIQLLAAQLRRAQTQIKALVMQRQADEVEAWRKATGDTSPVPATARLAPEPLGIGSIPKSCLQEAPGRLRIATYNIWHVNEPWPLRRDAMVGWWVADGFDVLALQECRRVDGQLQSELLVDLLNRRSGQGGTYTATYAKVMDVPANEGVEEGLAVLTRFPVIEAEAHDLVPEDGNVKAKRVLLHVVVDVPLVGATDVFVTHAPVFDMEQCHTMRRIAEITSDVLRQHSRPQVLLGDFNVYHDFEFPVFVLTHDASHPIHRSPRNPCSPGPTTGAGDSPVWEDVYEVVFPAQSLHAPALGDTERWWSVQPRPLATTFSNYRDHRVQDPSRPDRVLVRGGVDVCGMWLFGEQPLPCGGPVCYASDHRGVGAVLRLSPPQ